LLVQIIDWSTIYGRFSYFLLCFKVLSVGLPLSPDLYVYLKICYSGRVVVHRYVGHCPFREHNNVDAPKYFVGSSKDAVFKQFRSMSHKILKETRHAIYV
jgi:hypothetical protein